MLCRQGHTSLTAGTVLHKTPKMLQLSSERALPQRGLAPTHCLPPSDTPPHRELSESNATTVPSCCLSQHSFSHPLISPCGNKLSRPGSTP